MCFQSVGCEALVYRDQSVVPEARSWTPQAQLPWTLYRQELAKAGVDRKDVFITTKWPGCDLRGLHRVIVDLWLQISSLYPKDPRLHRNQVERRVWLEAASNCRSLRKGWRFWPSGSRMQFLIVFFGGSRSKFRVYNYVTIYSIWELWSHVTSGEVVGLCQEFPLLSRSNLSWFVIRIWPNFWRNLTSRSFSSPSFLCRTTLTSCWSIFLQATVVRPGACGFVLHREAFLLFFFVFFSDSFSSSASSSSFSLVLDLLLIVCLFCCSCGCRYCYCDLQYFAYSNYWPCVGVVHSGRLPQQGCFASDWCQQFQEVELGLAWVLSWVWVMASILLLLLCSSELKLPDGFAQPWILQGPKTYNTPIANTCQSIRYFKRWIVAVELGSFTQCKPWALNSWRVALSPNRNPWWPLPKSHRRPRPRYSGNVGNTTRHPGIFLKSIGKHLGKKWW